MKKISVIIVLFMFSIMSLNISNFTVKAMTSETGAETGIVFSDENIIVKQLEKTEVYEKIEIMYRDSGEVEYLETFANFNAEPTYKVTASDGEVSTIQKVDDKVYMDGEVVAEIEKQNVADDNLKTDNARATWKKLGSYKTSSKVYSNGYAFIASMIASAAGIPAAAVTYAVVSYVQSMIFDYVYYDVQQYRHTTTYGLAKNEYKIYKYSNYSGLISSGSAQFYYAWQ